MATPPSDQPQHPGNPTPTPSDADRTARIELVPPSVHAVPKYVLREDGTDITHEQLLTPIPEEPPHLCPSCDYILTGLRSRRCPECGALFDLLEARRHGARNLPHIRADMRAVALDSIGLIGGLALYIISPLTAAKLLSGRPGPWGAWMVFAAVLVATGSLMYRVYFQRSLTDMAVTAGLAALATSGMLVALFY